MKHKLIDHYKLTIINSFINQNLNNNKNLKKDPKIKNVRSDITQRTPHKKTLSPNS